MLDQNRKTILITGATGYIGRRLTEELLRSGQYNIRLLARNRLKIQASIAEKAEIFEGDTFSPEALDRALQGVDTAFYLIHSMGSKHDYGTLDRKSADLFRRASIKNGINRIIYLGGLGVRESASKHLLSRLETGEVLSKEPDRIQTIWLRAGVIIGSGSASFEIIRNLCQKLPVMLTPRWVKTMTQPIGITDVLSYLIGSIELDHRNDLIVDIGSAPLSFEDMMAQAAETMNLKRYIIPLPVLSPRLSSYWLVLFTPVPYKLASALIEGLKSETVKQNDNAALFYPSIKPRDFRDCVAEAMTALEQQQIISRWCDSSGDKACDIKDFDDPAGAILRDTRIIPFSNGDTPENVFNSVCSIGGKAGWFRYNFLWRLRGLIDKLAGGYGLNRGRRLGRELRIGDALDFWKVADIKQGKRLLLYAQMKLPGQAWLEFDIQPGQLVQTAHFIPRGLLGRIYWYSVLPLHYFVFSNLAKSIVQVSRNT